MNRMKLSDHVPAIVRAALLLCKEQDLGEQSSANTMLVGRRERLGCLHTPNPLRLGDKLPGSRRKHVSLPGWDW
jgi:hypothetical protein